jgi:sucrose-6-phosphate hydrolase SacC (GH32 family)
MKEYEVGQIIYLLSPKTLKVLPSLIVEEITRKTVEETQTQFVVQMPDEKKTRVTIDEVKAKIFSDVESLREFMINNATHTIDQLIKNAVKEKEINFGHDKLEISLEENVVKGVQNSEVGVIINNEKDKNTQTLEAE